MNFPRFWAKGQTPVTGNWWRRRMFESWGWSNVSVEEARKRAEENARRIAARFAAGENIEHRRYYGDRPFREEILHTIDNGEGLAKALITRNSYGCHVLNAAGVMFIDVDMNDGPDNSDSNWWSEILVRQRAPPPPKDENVIIQRARDWAGSNAGWGWRVYRTRAGLRFVATHDFFDPDTMARSSLFDALTADALYRKLCQNQKCFRARLTPKPWRCDFEPLKVSWPWPSEKAERQFLDWEKKYLKASAEYSTCELITTIGNSQMHDQIAPIMRLHDEKTRVGSGLPLA